MAGHGSASGAGSSAESTVLPALHCFDGVAASWKGQSVVSIDQFNRESIDLVRRVVVQMEQIARDPLARVGSDGVVSREASGVVGSELLKGRVLANVFYEPSTRTSCSFQAAMLRLGGTVVPVAESSSSAKKGETLSDTARCLACYTDGIVLRHPEKGSARVAAAAVDVPVLNAGDGGGEHPTQALLDLVTIFAEIRTRGLPSKDLHVVLLGDLKHGRTVHSLLKALRHFPDVISKVTCVAPAALSMPDEYVTAATSSGLDVSQTTDLDTVWRDADVVYVTRIQKERFEDPSVYETLANSYCINSELMASAKENLTLMHPLPRVNEIHTSVDDDPRAAYFRQMTHGMHTRMALLTLLLGPTAIDTIPAP